MKLISGETRENTWLEAVRYLAKEAEEGIEYNLILEVLKPSISTEISKSIRLGADQLLKEAKKYPVHTVAETIFPATLYKTHGIEGFYEKYPREVYPIIKKYRGNTKGTYAYRVVRGINPKGEECNPLKATISRLKGQLSRKDDNGIRCAFDLSVDDVESIPINRNDSLLQGFPCMSHMSFKLSHDRSELLLTAVYRSQDFIQKALGNLLGLARLQSCVAREIGISVGPLICHATMARLDVHKNVGKMRIQQFLDTYYGD